jgi:hypothetical protein
MSDCSAPEIREAYEEVRNDSAETNWMLITYEPGSGNKRWVLAGKGTGGLEELKASIGSDFLGYGYLRVTSGDDMSKRAKFVFIKYLSKGLKMNIKAVMNLHRGDVERVLNQATVTIEAETLEDLSEEEIGGRVHKAGGAHYD